MLGVMIIPTGIGAEIGGHSGDATSAAHLMAACCDQLILHPNVVNASDFTEQPANSLYVEGALLDTFLAGSIRLQPVTSNHILVVCNEAERDTLNCVNAMRSLLGISVEVVVLKKPLKMEGFIDLMTGKATGIFLGVDELVKQIDGYDYDALAIHTPIEVDNETASNYVKNGGINPWGGVEAMLSKEIYWRTGKPNAHAPVEGHAGYEYGVVDPRLAPEMLCSAHLGCVLRGLSKAPRPTADAELGSIHSRMVDILISPLCWGPPHEICRDKKIPMLFIKDNLTVGATEFWEHEGDDCVIVQSYLEAAGALMMKRLGRTLASVLRPIKHVHVKYGEIR